MDVEYDPLAHLSTAVSLLPRTLAGVGFSLPVGLSEMDQTKAFFDHMYRILQKDQKSGTMSLDKGPGPNPRTIEKEWDGAGKRCSEERNLDKLSSLESVKIMQQGSTTSRNSNASPKPATIDSNEAGKSLEGQQLDVKLESSEFMELQIQHNINSHTNKLNTNTNRSVVETHEVAKDSSEGKIGDTNLKFVKATMLKPWPSINVIANNLSPSLDNTNPDIAKAGNIDFEGKKQYRSSESVGLTDMEQPHRNAIRVSELSPIPDRMMLQKDEVEKINSGETSLDFRNADAVLKSGRSISSGPHNPRQVPDKREMERNISVKNSSHPEQTVESREIGRRPGLGHVYNISPFTLVQKSEKAKQVVPVDFTVLDHMSDANAFTKKAYELEAAVKEIERLGGQPKIMGERVFKVVVDDQPRKRRPGLGLHMQQPKFVPLPMRPLPAQVHYACACAYKSKSPAQSAISPETIKVKASSESKNESPSSISNATKEVPRMKLHASSSLQKLLSILESCADDEEKAVPMIFDWLNLKPTVITPLVIPEFPKCSVFDSVRSPWRQLPSIERVRELREEDPSVAFEELKRKFFTSPPADYSDDNNTPSVWSGSFRSPSTSPGCNFSFEDEEIGTPSPAGPSGDPNVEIEEFPCQEKVPEMISDTRGVKNFSEEAVASDYVPDEPEIGAPSNDYVPEEPEMGAPSNDYVPEEPEMGPPLNDYVPEEPEMGAPLNGYVPDEPEMGSPCNNLHSNIEKVVSSMLFENSPVNAEEGSLKETSSRKAKKRGLEHADSSLDTQSEIPMPTSDTNTLAQAETSLMEPPTERDEQMAPPKKRTKKQEKKRSSIKIIEGGLKEVGGVRRSTRIRSRPLRHWMGERFLYARIEDEFPTAVGVKECSPATLGLRVKVKSFVSDKHADLVARIAK